MRPEELARELGVSGLQLRNFLRAAYPRPESLKGSPWFLASDQVAAARVYFGEHRSGSALPGPSPARLGGPPAGPIFRDWFWEGNVQKAIVRFLKREGWTIEATADTAVKEQGDDIRASRDGRVLRVEVKGWPTKGYADPRRANEMKRTQPSTQAAHWFSQAILRVLRDIGRHPGDLVAIGLPDWPRFRALLLDTERPLRKLRVGVFLVGSAGSVELLLPLPSY